MRNDPIKIGNRKLVVYGQDGWREYTIPDFVHKSRNRVVVSRGRIFVNDYELVGQNWIWSFRAWVMGWLA